jgi:hypothetical protein
MERKREIVDRRRRTRRYERERERERKKERKRNSEMLLFLPPHPIVMPLLLLSLL